MQTEDSEDDVVDSDFDVSEEEEHRASSEEEVACCEWEGADLCRTRGALWEEGGLVWGEGMTAVLE